MKSHTLCLSLHVRTLAGIILALSATATARAADISTPTLKDAYKGHFYIGVAINRTIATGTPVRVDNVNRTQEQVNRDIVLVKKQFNQIVPENDTKWALIHPRPGPDGYDFAPADAFVNFGLSNNMYLVGHTLVWHSQTPAWVFASTNSATYTNALAGNSAPGPAGPARGVIGGPGRAPSEQVTREELLQRLHDHIATVVGRYKGKIKVWDVVNEALADGGTNVLRSSQWSQIIGPDYIAKAFEFAHEADPDAILRYNDYSLESATKRRKLITLIRGLQERHVPVMAIGSQTHASISSPSFEQEDQTLTELESLGLPIHITEFDVNSAQGGQRNPAADISANAPANPGFIDEANRRLADAYTGLFRAFLKHEKSVTVVTFWGANDAVTWRIGSNPLLFDGNDRPKPAFDAVIRVANGTPDPKL